MSKLQIFSPDAVQETWYEPGGHVARPRGRIVAPAHDELLLLHYKLLGQEYVRDRHEQLRSRLRSTDVANRWGIHWSGAADSLDEETGNLHGRIEDVSTQGARADGTPVWWTHFQRAIGWHGGVDAVSRELAAEREEIASLQSRIEALTTDRNELVERSKAVCAEVDELKRASATIHSQRADALARADELAAHAAEAQARVTALECSRTWRWSRPLRRVVDAFLACGRAIRRLTTPTHHSESRWSVVPYRSTSPRRVFAADAAFRRSRNCRSYGALR